MTYSDGVSSFASAELMEVCCVENSTIVQVNPANQYLPLEVGNISIFYDVLTSYEANYVVQVSYRSHSLERCSCASICFLVNCCCLVLGHQHESLFQSVMDCGGICMHLSSRGRSTVFQEVYCTIKSSSCFVCSFHHLGFNWN